MSGQRVRSVPSDKSSGQKTRPIVMIEDDAVVADMYAIVLRQNGWKVEIAPDGRTGSARVANSNPSLVLLDLGLPDRPGLEVLVEIRARPAAAKIPVVVFTNFDDANLLRSAMRMGATACLLKANTSPGLLAKKVAFLLD